MALDSWIDSATLRPVRPVGSGTEQDAAHVLYTPAAEREYELAERERARRTVRRVARDDAEADELLAMLGLDEKVSG